MLQDPLLTLEQITTGVTVLAINACRSSGQSVRIRASRSEFLALVRDCEEDSGTYDAC
jgi:hypothetical protein